MNSVFIVGINVHCHDCRWTYCPWSTRQRVSAWMSPMITPWSIVWQPREATSSLTVMNRCWFLYLFCFLYIFYDHGGGLGPGRVRIAPMFLWACHEKWLKAGSWLSVARSWTAQSVKDDLQSWVRYAIQASLMKFATFWAPKTVCMTKFTCWSRICRVIRHRHSGLLLTRHNTFHCQNCILLMARVWEWIKKKNICIYISTPRQRIRVFKTGGGNVMRPGLILASLCICLPNHDVQSKMPHA